MDDTTKTTDANPEVEIAAGPEEVVAEEAAAAPAVEAAPAEEAPAA